MNQKDGGPAFASPQFAVPQGLSEEHIMLLRSLCGMSMRQYYKAHAPTEIPSWFWPKLDIELPRMPALTKIKPESDREIAQSWKRDPCFDLAEEYPQLAWFEDACVARWKARKEQERLEMVERVRQWPGHWADLMLAEDDAHNGRTD